MVSRLRVNEVESLGGVNRNVEELVTGPSLNVDSISALQVLSTTTPVDYIHVLGYYNAGDGGGGVYRKDTSGAEADNGGSIIVDASGNRWKLQEKEGYSIKQFGAKGDGSNNDTSAIQTAIDAAYNDNIRKVYVPYSEFGYVVSHGIDLSPGVSLKGADSLYLPNLYPANAANDMSEFVKGHTFVVTSAEQALDPATNELIRVRDGTSIIGINVVHRDQVETNPPDVYPPVIRLQPAGSNGFNIKECLFLNPYEGIDALGGHQNLDIENVYMEPMRWGVRMSEATQVDRINGLDIGGFWHRRNWSDVEDDPNSVVHYIQANCVGVEMGRSDAYQMSGCLFFGVAKGILFNGSLGKAYGTISNTSFDANDYCIHSEAGSNSNGNLVSNCSIIPRSAAGSEITGVYIAEASDVDAWEFSNCSSWGGNAKRFMVVENGKVRLSNVRIQDWDKENDAAITLIGGHITLSNVDFAGIGAGAGNYISIPDVSTATVRASSITWDGSSDSTFQAYDPNGILQWFAETESTADPSQLAESSALGGFIYKNTSDVLWFSAWMDAIEQSEPASFVVSFDSTVTGSRGFDTVSSSFTAPVGGIYHFSYSLLKDSGAGLLSGLNSFLRVNGSTRGVPAAFLNKTGDDAEGFVYVSQSMIRELSAGDVVDVWHSGPQKLLGANGSNEARCWFQGYLL